MQTINRNYFFVKLLIKFALVFFFLFSCILLVSCTKDNENKNKEINIIFRLDDYSKYSNTKIEKQIFEIFRNLNLSLSLAVIPYNNLENCHSINCENYPISEYKEKLLKQTFNDGVIDPVLHGFNHKAIDYNTVWLTEFKGIEYEEQYYRIKKGKTYLEKIINDKIKIFVPPWNSYDKNTIRALDKLEFTMISAAPYQGEYCKVSNIKYLPFTCELYELESALDYIYSNNVREACIVVLFHPTDFLENESGVSKLDLKDFETKLKYISEKEYINIYTLSEYAGIDTNLSVNRFLMNKSIYRKASFIPPQIFSGKWFVYFDNEKSNLNSYLRIFLIIYYLIIGVLGFLLIKICSYIIIKIIPKHISIFQKHKNRKLMSILLSIFIWLVVLFATIYALHDFDINYRGLTVVVLAPFVSLSTYIYLYNKS